MLTLSSFASQTIPWQSDETATTSNALSHSLLIENDVLSLDHTSSVYAKFISAKPYPGLTWSRMSSTSTRPPLSAEVVFTVMLKSSIPPNGTASTME